MTGTIQHNESLLASQQKELAEVREKALVMSRRAEERMQATEQYFLYGVLKGLVDTIGGVLKLAIELPWIVFL
ncbi:hypothetical protein [Paenibacillus xylaniclasticus]|uniref:hypothetical protein n=1 Tax=Paenibacillus xylaniclasticus TaxID=588083 RepID=UPI000FDBDD68|nr:hypothetical protein [Paenibacillus xylaniclasticus]